MKPLSPRLALVGLVASALLGCATSPPAPPPPPPPPPSFRIDVGGSGSGTISSTPSGINCTLNQGAASGVCFAAYESGKSLTLAASASVDWEFQSWNGGSCGAGPTCQFAVTGNASIAATFDRAGGPGIMQLNLTSAAPNTGAIVLQVSGGAITGVSPASGYQVRLGTLGQAQTRILIRGTIGAGRLADLQVTDRKAAFAVTVSSAAATAAGQYATISSQSYQAAVVRP